MGFLKHFRSKARLRESSSNNNHGPTASTYTSAYSSAQHSRLNLGPDYTARLPDRVLAQILTFVCPHVADSTYEPCESSQIGDGCMLCDLRELAHCAGLARRWRRVAEVLLYRSVRIDAVHYCQREYELAELRRKKHFRSRSTQQDVGVGVDPPSARLALLCRTLWDRPDLAARTEFLKITYMTRETAKADLARTVAALPNLRYTDLPEGFYSGDPSCAALRQELETRCPQIRKMAYRSGAEAALQLLSHGYWSRLEELELSAIVVEPATLRMILASLPQLVDLSLTEMSWMDDSIFQPLLPQVPDFPAVRRLKLVDVPRVTTNGIRMWLEQTSARRTLSSLTLQGTGITAQDLHSLAPLATSLTDLAITETVATSLGLAAAQLPAISSRSLRTLHFEITNAEDIQALQKPAESYYAYLAASLHANALPALRTLYVRDSTFADLLLLEPVLAPFAGGAPPAPGTGFNQTLEIFSKGIDESDWLFTSIMPEPAPAPQQAAGGKRDSQLLVSGGRPLSAYSASRGLGPQWAQGGFGGEARKSVIVGNGFGGFLAVPQEEVPRPMTADGTRKPPAAPWMNGEEGGAGGQQRRFSFLRPPPLFGNPGEKKGHERKGSKRDLWR